MEVLYNVAAGIILSLGSSTMNGIGLWWGLKGELDKLRRTVDTIQAVLLHAEEQSTHNPAVKNWLGMLGEALYDAEDLLDELSYETLRQQLIGGSKVTRKVRLFFSNSNQVAFGLKMGYKVKDLNKRLDEIAAEKNKFHLEERSSAMRSYVPKDRYQTHSSPPQVVIGRVHDKEKIVQVLLSADCDENVSVVSIVGIGGLGKTTLAQMVYNDVNITDHFKLKMWVCVSNDFDVQLLVKKTLESATGKNVNNTEMDPLKNRLHEEINGRKYLLVLDDVWNEDVKKWSSFRDLLAGGARGSKIVITTRIWKVAQMSRPICNHELRGLSDYESWSLFKQVAFKQGHLPNPSLEATGKAIVAKCGGVPLAIRTIGEMLYFKDSESEWLLFKDKELSTIDVYKNDILPILKLSYNHLPSHYKHCFAYCSLYPKYFQIPVEELIQLWKAQGYLNSTDSNDCLRDVGLEYFKDLFQLSFFQDVEEDVSGNRYCTMHDLMHDLAASVAGDNFSQSSDRQMTCIKNNTRHISFQGYDLRHDSSLLETKKIRTILTLGFHEHHVFGKHEVDAMFRNLKCLRVLDLSRIRTNTLPNSICKMKHLRYLDLSHNHHIQELPNSLGNLHFLQVLKLVDCEDLMKWPSNFSKLVNLIELDNRECDKLNYMPHGIGKLTRLERLPEFVIGKDHSVSKHVGGLDELHSLNKLRGEMEIKNLRSLTNAALEFREALLSSKHKLQELKLDWGRHEDSDNDEIEMEALCPHPNLEVLKLMNYEGVKPPSWLPSITNLVSVKFENCKSIEWIPPLDQLPCLKTLKAYGLTKLELIHVENGGRSSSSFPSLTELKLLKCPILKGFVKLSSQELPCFPCLTQLYIRDCPNLIHLPLFQELEIGDLDASVLFSVSQGNWNRKSYREKSVGDGMEELCQHLNLKQLVVSNYKGVNPPKWLPTITNLVSIIIEDCSSIERLPPFDHLSHLQNLRIFDLKKLEHIDVENGGGSFGFFPSLTCLTLWNCPNLKKFQSPSMQELPCFPRLSELSVRGCPNLTRLPLFPGLEYLEWEGMNSLMEILKMSTNPLFLFAQLQHLRISNREDCMQNEFNHWQNLVSIPTGLQYVSTLQILYISDFPSLECIPDWMPKLAALQELSISNSPQVEERCSSNSAEDWPKIFHIPNIIIGGKQIQRDCCYML